MAYDEALAARLRAALALHGDVAEKRMFGGLAFMRHGHMVVCATGQGLLARVGAGNHEAALARPHVGPMDMSGRTMRGFVVVAVEGLRGRALTAWVDRCVAFAETLPARAHPKT